MTLCLEGCCPPHPLPFPFLSQTVVSQPASLHARQARAVFPRCNKEYSLMGHAYMLHTYYICMDGLFLACKIQSIESAERQSGTSGIRFIELCLFIYFSYGTIGDAFIHEQGQGHLSTLTCVMSVSLSETRSLHALFFQSLQMHSVQRNV